MKTVTQTFNNLPTFLMEFDHLFQVSMFGQTWLGIGVAKKTRRQNRIRLSPATAVARRRPSQWL
jgi:hypothetical protein